MVAHQDLLRPGSAPPSEAALSTRRLGGGLMDTYEGVPIVKIPPVAQSHASRRHMSPSRTTLLHFCAENCKTRGDKFDKAMELLQSITRVSRHTLPPWDQDKLFEIEEMYERSLETKVIPNPIPLPTGLRISG